MAESAERGGGRMRSSTREEKVQWLLVNRALWAGIPDLGDHLGVYQQLRLSIWWPQFERVEEMLTNCGYYRRTTLVGDRQWGTYRALLVARQRLR